MNDLVSAYCAPNWDVSDIAEADCQPGALVEILGPHLTPDGLADHARTNAYEVMTALGRRYARVYVEGGAVEDIQSPSEAATAPPSETPS